jgi:hypothetical protein
MPPRGSVGRPRPRTPLTRWEPSLTSNEPDGVALCGSRGVRSAHSTKVEQTVEGDGESDLIEEKQSIGGLPVIPLCRSGYLRGTG